MELYWNVIKFTCGLMGDSSELIESVCEVFAEHKMSIEENNTFFSVYDHMYLKDLSREKSPKSIDPFNNSEICCMNNSKSELVENCNLYYFYGTDEFLKYKQTRKRCPNVKCTTKPCGIVINESNCASFMRTTLNACSLILQPIKFIQISGLHNYKTSRCSNVVLSPPVPIGMKKRLVQNKGFSRSQDRTTFLNFCPGAEVSFSNCGLGWNNLKLFADSLKNCTALSKLSLCNCERLPETFFSLLESNINLIHLQVTFRWSFDDTCLELATELRHVINLKVLALEGVFLEPNSITMRFIHSITTMRCLRSLSLKSCHMLPPTVIKLMKILTKCPLEELTLSGNNLSGVFHELSLLPDVSYKLLKQIEVRGAVLSKGDILGLTRFIEDVRLPLIQQIDMQWNDLLKKQDALESLAQTCERLFKTRPCTVVVCAEELAKELKQKGYSCLRVMNLGTHPGLDKLRYYSKKPFRQFIVTGK